MAQSNRLGTLHAGLRTACADSVGFWIPVSTMEELVRDAVQNAIRNLANGGLPTPIPGVRLRPVSAIPPPALTVATGTPVRFRSDPFALKVELFQDGQPGNVFSSVSFAFAATDFLLETNGFELVVRTRKATTTPSIDTNVPTRAAAIAAMGWGPAEVATFERFEEFVAFAGGSAIARLLADAMSPPQVPQAFSGFSLRGPLALSRLSGGPLGDGIAIVAAPGSRFVEPPCAGCSDTPGSTVSVEVTDFATETATWAIAPAPGSLPPSSAADPGVSGIYAYVPKVVFDQTFGPSAYPALSLGEAGSVGVFSYSWRGLVEFKRVALSLDLSDPGFLVSADCSFSLTTSVWIPLPCDERQEIGSASVKGDIDDIKIRSRFVVDRARATLRLESALENHLVRPVAADVDLFGWPLDVIMNRILAHNAPGMISSELDGAVRKGRLELAQLGSLQNRLPYPFNASSFHADADSMVIGVSARI